MIFNVITIISTIFGFYYFLKVENKYAFISFIISMGAWALGELCLDAHDRTTKKELEK